MSREYGFRPVRTRTGAEPTSMKGITVAAASTLEMFELLKYTTGTGLAALGAINIDGTDALYVGAKASSSSDSHTKMPAYFGSNIIFKVAVKELVDGTVLTATGGGSTTFADSSMVWADGTYGDDYLKGSVLEVDACDSGDASDGDELTVTASDASAGQVTFDSVGATGFASGDTAHFTKLGTHIFGAYSLGLQYDNTATTDGCRLVLDGGDGSSRFCRVIGWNDARTHLLVHIIAGPDQAIATQDT